MNKVVLRDRDISIINFINEMKFASLEQVRDFFYEDRTLVYPRRRLNQLCGMGLLSKHQSWGRAGSLYTANKRGLWFCEEKYSHVIQRELKKIDLKNFLHDSKLIDLRLFLEKGCHLNQWVSERSIRYFSNYLYVGDSKIIPDAYAKSVETGEIVVVEFENSIKSSKRIRELLLLYQGYFGENSKGSLLVASEDQSIIDRYQSIYDGMRMRFNKNFFVVEK